MRRQRFHRQRCSQAPFAAHPDSKKGAQKQKSCEIRGKGCEQFNNRIEHDVDHERDATTESVTEPAKDKRAQWAHHQRKSDRKSNLRDCLAEVMCDRNKDERQKEKVERVECPSEEAGNESFPLNAIQ